MPTDWEKMAAFTAPICAKGQYECIKPYRCCDIKYCRMAEEYAKTLGVTLQPTGNLELPYMGSDGCVVPPHLRPVCTIHVCTVSWAAKSHIEHDEKKLEEYLALRKKLEM